MTERRTSLLDAFRRPAHRVAGAAQEADRSGVDHDASAGAPARERTPAVPAAATDVQTVLVCGAPGDRTMLLVDWLILAARMHGRAATAMPLGGRDAPHATWISIATEPGAPLPEDGIPAGPADVLVAGEHMELVRAIRAGMADPERTTIVASLRRNLTDAERAMPAQAVVGERDIDALAEAASIRYHAFDGPEVAGWYQLSSTCQPGLLAGALQGSGVLDIGAAELDAAIHLLGVDAPLHRSAAARGVRFGRRAGSRVRRPKTSAQFVRRRRISVHHSSRRAFEELVDRAGTLVDAEHLPALQLAIHRACEFGDAQWGSVMVDHVESVVVEERSQATVRGVEVDPAESVVGDVVRALAAMMVWPDAAWTARRKLRAGRLRELRVHHGVGRGDAWELEDVIPVDEAELAQLRSDRVEQLAPARGADVEPLLAPLKLVRVRTTSARGQATLRKLAARGRHRTGTARFRRELDTIDDYLQVVREALRVDQTLARIVARSGTMVQGSGAVREANRASATAFWGRIARQAFQIDRATPSAEPDVSRILVPAAWRELCRSGSLALWEISGYVVGIGMAVSRGASHADAVELARRAVADG